MRNGDQPEILIAFALLAFSGFIFGVIVMGLLWWLT